MSTQPTPRRRPTRSHDRKAATTPASATTPPPDIDTALVQYGYPALTADRDVRRLPETLFPFIYEETTP